MATQTAMIEKGSEVNPCSSPKLLTATRTLLDFICPPLFRRSTSAKAAIKAPEAVLESNGERPRRHKRPSGFRSNYESFPAPFFTEGGQPRALDTRTWPEVLVDMSQSEHSSACNDTAPSNPSIPRLTVRGGAGNSKRLSSPTRIPLSVWWLAGGRSFPPPKAGDARKWKAREKARIIEENRKAGRLDKKGNPKETRPWWREMAWVLGGAKAQNFEKQNGSGNGSGSRGGGSGGGGTAAGGS